MWSSSMFVLLLSLLLLPLLSFAEENIDIAWTIRQYDDMAANVGDTITFNWTFVHNVYIHPSGTCDENGSRILQGGISSGATYTFTEADAGTEVVFACQIFGHCNAGQLLKVIVSSSGSGSAPVSIAPVSSAPVSIAPVSSAPVSSAPVSIAPVSSAPVSSAPVSLASADDADIVLDWIIKPSYEDETAMVGDTIQFNFAPFHNVYIHPSGNCDQSDSLEIGQTSGTTYTFTENDAGQDIYFACQISGHCAAGQIVKVTVAPAPVIVLDLDWIIKPSYEDETAMVGDTIRFNWAGVHNVYIHPSGSCDQSDSLEIGQSSGTTYTFTEGDAGQDIYFACQIPGHCAAGQIVKVTVAPAPVIVFDWIITSYEDETAMVGDTIQFNFAPFHNVYIHPSGSCDQSDSLEIGQTSGTTYTFTENDAGQDIYFACQISGHCDAGQIVKVTVAPAPVIVLDWIIKTYEDETAMVGDTIQFNYDPFHNVYIHPSGSCDQSDSLEIGQTSGTTYTFTEEDAGSDVYFACQISGHCDAGQIVKVSVAPTDIDIALDWVIRTYEDETAMVGDTIQFNWAGVHNVYIHPSGTCDGMDSIEIGQKSGAFYTFTEDDAGQDIYFACQITGHCGAGQILKVSVEPTATPAPAPSGGGGGFCFSGNTIVDVLGKGPTSISNLHIGDQVKTNNNKYDTVYSFGHHNPNQVGEFLQITTTNKSVIEMSKDHLLLVSDGRYIPASALTVGYQLVTVDHASAVINKIKTVQRKGLYAPFTMSGTIAIGDDNIIASSFVTLQENQDMVTIFNVPIISAHTMAYLFESLHRMTYHSFGNKEESYSSDGISNWVEEPRNFFMTMLNSPSITYQIAILLPCIGVLALVNLMEVFYSTNGVILLLFLFSIVTAVRRHRQKAIYN